MTDPRQHIMPVYRPPEEVFVEGQGAYLFAEDGSRYLDFIAGIAVTALGHAYPPMVDALRDQAGKLWHTSNMFRVPAAEQLADKICRDTFADRVFFTNSGTEAERIDIITFTGAFHGRSLGAINAGGNPKYLEGFGPKLPGFVHLEWGDHEALKEAAASPTAAAIFVEPVQGEGGVRAMPDQCLIGLRELCDEHGILMILDEVQCGMGRTGKLFAHDWVEGAEPDILCAAKGIGGGFPFGACLTTEACAEHMQPGSHGSTYGGNPLAMAVGNVVWDTIANADFLAEVRRVSGTLAQGLKSLADSHPDKVEGVTGKGLLTGLKMKSDPKGLQGVCRDNNLLVGVAGANVLRLAPPLIITDEHVREATGIIDVALTEWTPA
jgi:acetylornithine/N-succinyldiaminopimelate aminotransferase